jgi:type III pantothenate kinase
MILTVLVGNTNTRITGLRGRRIACRRVVKSESYLANTARNLSGLSGVEAVALAGVPPGSLSATRKAVASVYGLEVFDVNHKTRTGLKIRYNRSQLGADRICAIVGARSRFPAEDILVLDVGTAVTVNVVTSDGEFLGGAILPGQSLMLSSLSRIPARLPKASPATRKKIIQHGTRQAMQAGVRHILLGGLGRIVSMVQEETGRVFGVVATGGDAGLLRGRIENLRAIDTDLAARGLAVLCRMNAAGRALPRPSQTAAC